MFVACVTFARYIRGCYQNRVRMDRGSKSLKHGLSSAIAFMRLLEEANCGLNFVGISARLYSELANSGAVCRVLARPVRSRGDEAPSCRCRGL